MLLDVERQGHKFYTMKGMSIEQYKEMIDFIQKHHKFGWVDDKTRIKIKGEDHQLHIKYVDCCYDSRFGDIWLVKFRGGGMDLRFATNHFNAVNPAPDYFKYEKLFDWVMDFLKGEWTNRQILKDCAVSDK